MFAGGWCWRLEEGTWVQRLARLPMTCSGFSGPLLLKAGLAFLSRLQQKTRIFKNYQPGDGRDSTDHGDIHASKADFMNVLAKSQARRPLLWSQMNISIEVFLQRKFPCHKFPVRHKSSKKTFLKDQISFPSFSSPFQRRGRVLGLLTAPQQQLVTFLCFVNSDCHCAVWVREWWKPAKQVIHRKIRSVHTLKTQRLGPLLFRCSFFQT